MAARTLKKIMDLLRCEVYPTLTVLSTMCYVHRVLILHVGHQRDRVNHPDELTLIGAQLVNVACWGSVCRKVIWAWQPRELQTLGHIQHLHVHFVCENN